MAPEDRMGLAADRDGDATPVAAALDALLGGRFGKGLSDAQRAARAWYSANGDRERAHTTGVWLQKSGRAGVDPVLVVGVDSGLLAADLSANKDLYLQRLSFHGVRVSDLRFRVQPHASQGANAGQAGRARGTGVSRETPRTPPTQEELDRVERATADLPDPLRASVSRAMLASLERSRSEEGKARR